MTVEYKNKLNRALDNAAMSAKMEGLNLTPQIRKQCIDILMGTKSLNECIAEINAKYAVQE